MQTRKEAFSLIWDLNSTGTILRREANNNWKSAYIHALSKEDSMHPITQLGSCRNRGNISRIFALKDRTCDLASPVVVDYSRNGGYLRRQETTTRRCVELEFEPEALDQPLTSIATSTSTFRRVQPRGCRSIRLTRLTFLCAFFL